MHHGQVAVLGDQVHGSGQMVVVGHAAELAVGLGPEGAWLATLEDGTRVSAETLRRVACDCSLIGHEGEALSIGPETNRPQWDGTRPDYEMAISALLEAG